MSTERELAPGGPAQLHSLPMTFPDIGASLAVGIIGKVYGMYDFLCKVFEIFLLFFYLFIYVFISCLILLIF